MERRMHEDEVVQERKKEVEGVGKKGAEQLVEMMDKEYKDGR